METHVKVLICGAGKLTRELLGRMAETWQATVIDIQQAQIEQLLDHFPDVVTRVGDVASVVVLEEVGIEKFDYVLCLTGSDRANLATAKMASEKGVTHILALAGDHDIIATFRDMGVRAVDPMSMLAGNIFHYLQDPRINVTPLAMGHGAVLEVDASHHFLVVGRTIRDVRESDWRLAAIIREGRLIFPDPEDTVEAGDHLVIVGEPDIFGSVCTLLECGNPHFPAAYGRGLLVAFPEGCDELDPLLQEGGHLARNTKVQSVSILCPEGMEESVEDRAAWPGSMLPEVYRVNKRHVEAIRDTVRKKDVGLVVMPSVDGGLLGGLGRPSLAHLATELKTPLLIARNTFPYERILVPYDGGPAAERALEVGVDLSRQLDATVTAVMVEEPGFLSGESEEDWLEQVRARLHNQAHIHKTNIEEIVRRGNPVKEATAVARDFDLMVIGSSGQEGGFLSPSLSENLTRKAACSVLLLPGDVPGGM
jgi:Trk K+ transport system NAD-binding subunit/nucleotide-binding universal stress UspA family protein